MSSTIVSSAKNSSGSVINYSCCFALTISSQASFKEEALSKINLIKNSNIKDIIDFFEISIDIDDNLNDSNTKIEDLFYLENYKYYLELKKLKSIIIDAINHVASKIELDRVAVCQNPLGGILLIFSSQYSQDQIEDFITHYYLDLIEMSGILK